MTHPDVIVKEGRIYDCLTDVELPSYSGLCLADLAGRFAIMFTTLAENGRTWELVHWGSTLSSTEMEKFYKGKQ